MTEGDHYDNRRF